MTKSKWYALMDMPGAVTQRLGEICPVAVPREVREKYLCRRTAEEGFEQLKGLMGEDPGNMKLLYAVLEMAGETWEKYRQKGIPPEIFAETMKLVPRFLRTHYRQNGEWQFNLGWWFWRELAMEEYRLGCLEYELVEEEGRCFISLHIPSDADLSAQSIDESFARCRAFLHTYYPAWENLPWECDSWMMSPALERLLPENSRILAFNRRFQVLAENKESLGVLDWVFPGHREISQSLPENTSLQRNMKKWLLSGEKVGWTRAVLKK